MGRMELRDLAARRVLHVSVAYLYKQNGVNEHEWPISGGRMGLMDLTARRVQHVDVAYLYKQNGVNGLALYFATPTTLQQTHYVMQIKVN